MGSLNDSTAGEREAFPARIEASSPFRGLIIRWRAVIFGWEVQRMDETKRAWDEVGAELSRLGQMVSERHRRLGEERPSRAVADQSGVSDALRRATDELDRAFTSLGDTLRDEQAKQHLRDTGQKLGDALKVTFTEVSEEVRRAVGTKPPSGSGGSSPAPPPPTAS